MQGETVKYCICVIKCLVNWICYNRYSKLWL